MTTDAGPAGTDTGAGTPAAGGTGTHRRSGPRRIVRPRARSRTHTTDCTCESCLRAGHGRARAEFAEHRDELAEGIGIPEAVSYSPEASRQWVSDELTQSARDVCAHGRAAGDAWLAALARHTVIVLWSAVGLLLLAQLVTALDGGWTLSRTAALLAAVVLAALLSAAAWLHRGTGGVFTPLVSEDNRFSTSRAVAAGWLLLTGYAGLLLAVTLAGTGSRSERTALLEGLNLADAAALLTVLGSTLAAAVWVRHTVTRRVRRFAMQKVRAARPRASVTVAD